MFWPGRSIDQITKDEAIYTEHEQRSEGLLLWCPFNSLLNSSRRTELAAAIVVIIPPVPVHIGIDNVAVVGKGSHIMKYYDEKERMKRREEGKGTKLGGTSSRLRRSTSFKKPRRLMKDGDSQKQSKQEVRDAQRFQKRRGMQPKEW